MAIGKRVTVIDYPDGRLVIRYRGVELAYRTFDKIRQVSQAAIVENKQLGAALAFIREQQLSVAVDHAGASSSCVANLSVAVDHAGATSATPACSRSAELSYEPSERALARQINRYAQSDDGRALRYAGAPRPPAVRPQSPRSDISKWQKE